MENGTVEHGRRIAHHDERQEDERRKQSIEKQDRNDGIAIECLLLTRIVESQQRRREEC